MTFVIFDEMTECSMSRALLDLTFVASGRVPGKSGALPLMVSPSEAKTVHLTKVRCRIMNLELRITSKKRKEFSLFIIHNSYFIILHRTFVRCIGYDKARFQENSLRLLLQNPYRNPTQVVSSSRARRTSEISPRNSAKKQP